MVSVYHDEKGKLAMTHYCAIGNQPRLALEKEDHMHSLEITFLGPGQVRQEWGGYRGGKLEKPTVLMLTRVKDAANTQ